MFNFTTKKTLRVEVENLNKDVNTLISNNVKLRKHNIQLKNEKEELTEIIEQDIVQMEEYKKEIIELNKKLESKELQRRKLACKIGGLNTSSNKTLKELGEAKTKIKTMEQEIKDLKNKLAESMTDKYIVKKIPSGRTPKPERMRIKSHAKQSKIIKEIMEG